MSEFKLTDDILLQAVRDAFGNNWKASVHVADQIDRAYHAHRITHGVFQSGRRPLRPLILEKLKKLERRGLVEMVKGMGSYGYRWRIKNPVSHGANGQHGEN